VSILFVVGREIIVHALCVVHVIPLSMISDSLRRQMEGWYLRPSRVRVAS
jgi:hypothetical protein